MATVLLATVDRYDVPALASEVETVRGVLDFGAGTFAHSISLPAAAELAPEYRAHRNNVPAADALGRCPRLKGIFDSLRAEKACFRLLRRVAGSAYSLHDDRDMGDDIVRLQLPIVTDESSLMMVQREGTELEPIARRVAGLCAGGAGDLRFDYRRLLDLFGEWFALYPLAAGYLYHFDTDLVHTLINAGSAARVTLAVDLVRNDWLDQWAPASLVREIEEVAADELPPGEWEWDTLRHGLLTHPRVRLA